MKLRVLAAHFCVPSLIAAGTYAVAASRESSGPEMLVASVLWGFLFYAAPHLVWTMIAAAGKFSTPVWHAGFIASFWLGSGDSSGLPIQWMLYWPLAIVLMAVVPSVVSLVRKRRQANA